MFRAAHDSPLGPMTIFGAGAAVHAVLFVGQKHELKLPAEPGETAAMAQMRRELDLYFAGRLQQFSAPLAPVGTPFQQAVWRALLAIPYGETLTYGAIASRLGKPAAARAIGAAVGRNPISVAIPCHRVVGAGGALTGYAAGLERKRALLALEGGPTRLNPISRSARQSG